MPATLYRSTANGLDVNSISIVGYRRDIPIPIENVAAEKRSGKEMAFNCDYMHGNAVMAGYGQFEIWSKLVVKTE